MRLLRGTLSSVPSPVITTEYIYTRKKRRIATPPQESDHIAFRWNGSLFPQFVVRSPLNREVWITPEERQTITAELVQAGWAFTTRKGPYLVKPEKGAIGWRPLVGISGRRFQCEHNGFGWNEKYPERDDGT
jgi:hypothetical protein